MSQKDFILNDDDPVVQKFKEGLEEWERFPKAASKAKKKSVRTRGAVRSRGGKKAADFVLPEDDPVVKKFKEGLDRWEHFKKQD